MNLVLKASMFTQNVYKIADFQFHVSKYMHLITKHTLFQISHKEKEIHYFPLYSPGHGPLSYKNESLKNVYKSEPLFSSVRNHKLSQTLKIL